MTLQPLSALIQVKELPQAINANFTLIETNINALLSNLDTTNKSIKLVSALSSVSAGGVGAASLTLLNSTGTVVNILKQSGNTQTQVFFINADGEATMAKLVVTSSAESTIADDLRIGGATSMDGGANVNGVLDLSKQNSVVKHKYATVSIVDANTGASAASQVDLSKAHNVFMDFSNSGNALANGGAVKLLTTNFVEGQIVRIHCSGTNSSGMKFYNGTSGNEIFAYVNPSAGGFTSVGYSTLPAFTPSTSPNNQSWIECMWANIGSNTFRLLVLDSKNVTGVS